LHQGTAERDTRRQIARVDREAIAAGVDSFSMATSAAIFLRKLRKRNRRRILLDSASKVFNPIVFRHSAALEGRG
jgi:hypothetical protein